ncbi:MAG: DUF559 domain-containing protein [Micromonosporaceae bacterium]
MNGELVPRLRRDLMRDGMTVGKVRWLGRTGRWRRLRHAVYVDGAQASDDQAHDQLLQASAAALRLAGNAVLSHESAATWWRLPTLGRGSETVHLTRERRGQGATSAYPDMVVHHARLPEGHVVERNGLRVTTVARTVADLARSRGFRPGVIAADAALRRELCTRDDLAAVCRDCRRWPGVRVAKRVATFADPSAESALESLSRAALHEHGVPPPEPQAWITDYDRVDFLWRRERVIGEADGLGKYVNPDVLRREKERKEILERLGYAVVRWTWNEIHRRPDAVAHLVLSALSRRR